MYSFEVELVCHVSQCLLYSKFSSVQSLSRVRLFVTPWTAARQDSLSITNSKFTQTHGIESVIHGAVFRCRKIQSTTEKMIISSIRLLF